MRYRFLLLCCSVLALFFSSCQRLFEGDLKKQEKQKESEKRVQQLEDKQQQLMEEFKERLEESKKKSKLEQDKLIKKIKELDALYKKIAKDSEYTLSKQQKLEERLKQQGIDLQKYKLLIEQTKKEQKEKLKKELEAHRKGIEAIAKAKTEKDAKAMAKKQLEIVKKEIDAIKKKVEQKDLEIKNLKEQHAREKDPKKKEELGKKIIQAEAERDGLTQFLEALFAIAKSLVLIQVLPGMGHISLIVGVILKVIDSVGSDGVIKRFFTAVKKITTEIFRYASKYVQTKTGNDPNPQTSEGVVGRSVPTKCGGVQGTYKILRVLDTKYYLGQAEAAKKQCKKIYQVKEEWKCGDNYRCPE